MGLLYLYNYLCPSRGIARTEFQIATYLTFVCPYIASIIVNDDQQDATILAYLFIPNQLYVFRAMSSPIIRST